jgi:DNA-binding transcriptional MerR regulator
MNHDIDAFISNDEPLFNIGAVARMTDIPEATLRVWERRYDFPQVARTSGGHRLYSQQEVLRLQWVKSRMDEGMQVSQSIRALRQVEQDEPLRQLTEREITPPDSHTGNQHLERYTQRLFQALLNHDVNQANQFLQEMFMLYPVEILVLDVIIPILNQIGQWWAHGKITVATEHFASHHLRLHLLMWLRTAPPPYQVEPVILACAPGELHEGSLLVLAVLLRRLRWPVLYLGQSMPIQELTKFVNEFEKPIIVFSAATRETALALKDWPSILPKRGKHKHYIIGYGGRGFNENPELIKEIPGIFLGYTLPESVERLNRILHEINPALC